MTIEISGIGQLTICPGTLCDYDKLSRFHYRNGRPAMVSQVWSLVNDSGNVVSRIKGVHDVREVVGVLVVSYPTLNCKGRNLVNPKYVQIRDKRASAKALNRDIRRISRVVIHPRWRGLGLAVRLVKHAMGQSETRYLEALAVMGRVHPFLEKAGMQRYEVDTVETTPLYYFYEHTGKEN